MKPREFSVGDSVYVCDLPSKDNWLPATIIRATGPLSFEIKLSDGHTVRWHSDHLYSRVSATTETPPSDELTEILDPPTPVSLPSLPLPSPPQAPPKRSSRVPVRPDRLFVIGYSQSTVGGSVIM